MGNANFADNTRLKHIPLAVQTRPTGGGSTIVELPKTGILMGIMLPIGLTIAGTLSAPNALGLASCIKRIIVRTNSGHTLIDISGAGYHWLLADFIQDNYLMNSYTDARLAVTTGTKNLDMFLPIALNSRDEIGLIMLQNMQTVVTLEIQWEADATVATGATISAATASPNLLVFEVPSNEEALPDFDTIQQIVEETQSVVGAIDFIHNIAIGATYFGVYYLIPAGFTRSQLILQQTNIVYDLTPSQHRIWFMLLTSRDCNLSGGAITGSDKRLLWDFAGSDGLGQFGTVRDTINSEALTSFFTRVTVVGSTTMQVVRRQVVRIVS